MSPLLNIISLQWEGKDAYNFPMSNCVVSLHADHHNYGLICEKKGFSWIR